MKAKQSVLSAAALAALATLAVPMQAHALEVYLKAEATTVPDPNGGAAIPMWGYASCTAAYATCDPVSVPGPRLEVPPGETELVVHLQNTLNVPTSLVINGLYKSMAPVWTDPDGTNPSTSRTATNQRVRSFDAEAAPLSGMQTYTWLSPKPGTYLYQSGTHPQVQVQMGLYGAMTQDASAGVAYPGATYDNQALLFYSEIDPALHAAVSDGSYGTTGPTSTLDYKPKYFLINGKVYNNASTPIEPVGNPGKTLLRFVNAGLTTHVPMIEGAHWTMVAEDGKPYPYQTEQYTALLSAAKTMDVLLTANAGGAVYSIMDRRLNLSNNGNLDGGMLAFLKYDPAGTIGGTSASNPTPPLANSDSFDAIDGITLNVSAAEGLLINDDNTDGVPQPIKVVAATGTSLNGGSYTLNSNGSFSFTPSGPGVDSFTYNVTDGQALGVTPATVSINVTTPSAPSVGVLDSFDRAVPSNNLGADWDQVATTLSPPDVQADGTGAVAASVGLGGLAIYNPQDFGPNQGASFTSASPLTGSALVLKASGGTGTAPANYVRVRCESDGSSHKLVVATMMSGSNMSVYVSQASFDVPLCAGSGSLAAAINDHGIVTVFLGGSYVGGVQLPNVPAWTSANGKVGIQLQAQGAVIDEFSGGTLP